MRSMTGFGKATVSRTRFDLSVEVRSVNNRYLDISMRLPKQWSCLENRVRDAVKAQVSRGKISLNIDLREKFSEGGETSTDIAKFKHRYELLEKIKHELHLPEPITLHLLLAFQDEIAEDVTLMDDDESWRIISEGLNQALTSLNAMREAEGRHIRTDMEQRLKLIGEWTDYAEKHGKNNMHNEFDKLLQNVLNLIGEQKIDRNRLEQEIAVISDRVDITEECVRMKSHLELLSKSLNGKEDVGKKITFILQEMLREANTMNSKTTNLEIAHRVIEMKEEIEKMREQAQNLE